MYAMKYDIKLPDNYDMNIIKERVQNNGYKTDEFKDLLVKVYLISTKSYNNFTNSYSPLYLWENSEGMTEFIFNGYFDNIIASFGWHSINIGITYSFNITEKISDCKYVLEESIDIQPIHSLIKIKPNNLFCHFKESLTEIIIYNPDKWKIFKYSFVECLPKDIVNNITTYEILHISQ
jgi:hypothetical protein